MVVHSLTAQDRPYKKGNSLSECLHIMGKMKLDGHIDPELFDLFISGQVYLCYADQYLDAEQIDKIDITKIPGYTPIAN
jgi:HD-GYP domain-containing protein (c-di-GMP phosphodiesterase class II)